MQNNHINFAMAYMRWLADGSKANYWSPLGARFMINQADANEIAAKLSVYAKQIADNGVIPTHYPPANDYQASRVAKAYTDRGLKAA